MYFQLVLVTSLVHEHGQVEMENIIVRWRENVTAAGVDTEERNVILVPLDGGVADMAENAVQDTADVVVAGEAMVVKNMLWDFLTISTIIMTSCNSHNFMMFLDFTCNQFNTELIN